MENRNQYNKEVPPSSVTGRQATPDEVAYRDGYVRGRNAEMYDRVAQERQIRARERASNGAAGALTFAILIAAIAGIVGALFYYNQRPLEPAAEQEAPEQVENTTIIERTRETVETAPAPEITLPDVEINVPTVEETAPATEGSAPATEGSAPAVESTEPANTAEPAQEAESAQ